MKSEATAAAEFKGRAVMHDPFAMRPFFGYNIGHYIQHWLDMKKKENAKLPKIFHVNWFRQENDKFLWPGKIFLETYLVTLKEYNSNEIAICK